MLGSICDTAPKRAWTPFAVCGSTRCNQVLSTGYGQIVFHKPRTKGIPFVGGYQSGTNHEASAQLAGHSAGAFLYAQALRVESMPADSWWSRTADARSAP